MLDGKAVGAGVETDVEADVETDVEARLDRFESKARLRLNPPKSVESAKFYGIAALQKAEMNLGHRGHHYSRP